MGTNQPSVTPADITILELSLGCRNFISCPEYQVVGTQAWTKFTGIHEVKCSPEVDVCGTVTSLCVFLGCDTAGAFMNEGKLGDRKFVQI